MLRTLALFLAALALLGAGCGDDSKDTYSSDLRDVGQKLQDSSVGDELQSVKTPQELAAALNKAAGLLDDAAAELEDLEPPDDAANAHKKLTEGAHETADAFRQVAAKAESGNAQDVLSSISELTSSGGAAKLEAGLKELESKGYDVRNGDGK
jgi:hypothetical protein